MREYYILPADCLAALKKLPENSVDSMVTDPPYVVGHQSYSAPDIRGNSYDQGHVSERDRLGVPITQPATAESKLWQGFGTALKPANEPILLARKPLSEKTVAANVLKHGTGGINIDGCRVVGAFESGWSKSGSKESDNTSMTGKNYSRDPKPDNPQGRFPANLVLSHNEDCVEVGVKKVKGISTGTPKQMNNKVYGEYDESYTGTAPLYKNSDGTETVPEFHCTPGCAVAMLDEQSGIIKGEIGRPGRKAAGNYSASSYKVGVVTQTGIKDIGGASRFFYCAKASKSERNLGCEGLPEKDAPGSKRSTPAEGRSLALGAPRANHHPTVKPLKLMRYLCRLITPPNGIILDPFMGSGSTGIAALSEGFSFIGIEREQEYFKIALSRLRYTYFGDHSLWLKDLKREGAIFNPELLLILKEEDEYPKT